MILDATTKSLQVILGAAVTTTQLSCVTSWADITTTTFTPGSTDSQTNGTTAVTLVAAPAASTQRQVKMIAIYNADTASATVTVRYNNNSTLRPLVSVVLKTAQTLQFAENAWSVIDSTGGLQESGSAAAAVAGSDSQIMYNNGGVLGGDLNMTWNDLNQTMALSGTSPSITLAATTGAPGTPASGTVALFGRSVANRQLAAQVSSSGLSTALQPFLARNKIGYWAPPGNSTTTPGVFGMPSPAFVGTATTRSVATTNLAQRMRRLGFVSTATAGSLAGLYMGANQFTAGTGSNDGSGFYFVIRWVPSDAATVSGERSFVGMSNVTAAPTNVESNTLTNCLGVAQLSTDSAQLYLVYGGSAAQTPIALGSTNFPANTLSTVAYELAIYAPNSLSNVYYYQVTNITSGALTTGTLTGAATQVPQNSVLLSPRAYVCNNAQTLASGIDICSIYLETDN